MVGERYQVGTLIGRGGHGEVYRAIDVMEGTKVAIKFLASHLAADGDYRLRLVREARAMSALEGRGTLQVMGIISADDGTPCLVMELLEGMDLSQAIKEKNDAGTRFTIDEVMTLFMPVVGTLDRAHARDIIHRDPKPSNIYIVRGNLADPRIMDFGLAKTGDLAGDHRRSDARGVAIVRSPGDLEAGRARGRCPLGHLFACRRDVSDPYRRRADLSREARRHAHGGYYPGQHSEPAQGASGAARGDR